MERKFRLLISIFIVIMIVSLSGFYKSYIGFFPRGNHFTTVVHVHFIAFTLWFCLLTIQPLLIRRGQLAVHKKLGKLSYFLAPILLSTIIYLVIGKVKREVLISFDEASVTAFIGLLDALSFSAFFIIAMVNRRNVRWHVAFIIAASLIVLNPGMSRLLNLVKPGAGLIGAVLVPFIVSITIVLYEKLKLKRPILKSPYSLFFLCWTIEIVLLTIIPSTEVWRGLVKYIAN